MTWLEFKSIVDTKLLSQYIQYVEFSDYYDIHVCDGDTRYETEIIKDPNNQNIAGLDGAAATVDLDDWETNYKPSSNQVILKRSLDGIPHTNPLSADNTGQIELVGLKISAPPPTAPDTTLTTDSIKQTTMDRQFMGAFVWIRDGNFGDKIEFEVIDHDNLLGYGVDAVLGSYTEDCYVNDISMSFQFVSDTDKSNVPGGMYFRVRYVNNSDPVTGKTAKVVVWLSTKK